MRLNLGKPNPILVTPQNQKQEKPKKKKLKQCHEKKNKRKKNKISFNLTKQQLDNMKVEVGWTWPCWCFHPKNQKQKNRRWSTRIKINK